METEIKATLIAEQEINGVINLEPLRGAQGFSAYEVYVRSLLEGETPLNEQEWIDSLSKANYYAQYYSLYTTSTTGEKEIPIGIPEYNETCILEVYVDGIRLKNGFDYTLDLQSNTILLSTPLSEIGTQVYKICNKTSVIATSDYDLLRGPAGKDGLGVPAGGITGQILAKKSDTDNDTEWVDLSDKIATDIKNIKGKILWTNGTPTNEMSADTLINLSSDDYDVIEWIYAYSVNSTDNHVSSSCLKGKSPLLNVIGYSTGETSRRILDYVSNTQYKARVAYNGISQSGGFCIPLYAIGYKLQ